MNTKIVYVLTSSFEDFYLEQLLISVYSVKLHNPNIKVTLVVDDETFGTIVGERNLIRKYVSEIVSVKVPSKFNKIQKSRYLKTILRELIPGDYLFIDTDTVITGDLSELDNLTCSVGAVLDKHVSIDHHSGSKQIYKYINLLCCKLPKEGSYFNSGIMYVKDDPYAHTIYQSWHRNWLNCLNKNLSIDQPALAKANEENGFKIEELSGIYNCQIVENGLKYLYDAKIIHYYASNINSWDSPYLLRESKIYEEVRQNGISTYIQSLIQNAKTAFNTKSLVLGGRLCDSYYSTLSGLSRRIFQNYPRLNVFIDTLYKMIKIR